MLPCSSEPEASSFLAPSASGEHLQPPRETTERTKGKARTHLKWSCRATLKSKASPRSTNPTPIKARRPGEREERLESHNMAGARSQPRFTTPMVTAGQELDVFLPSPQKGNHHQLPGRGSNFILSAGLVTQGRKKIVAVLPDSQAALTSLLQPAGWIYGRGKSSFKIKVSESRPRLGSQRRLCVWMRPHTD